MFKNLLRWAKAQVAHGIRDERGSLDIQQSITWAIGGLICLVVALILVPVIITAAIAANPATAGSFSGVGALIGLVPLLFVVGIIGVAIFFGIKQFRNTG